MVSINTNSVFTPNETVSGSTSVTINGNKYTTSYCTKNDFIKEGIKPGFAQYTFLTIPELLYALNKELNSGRAVVAHTNGATEHWVTVTGTTTNKDATSFNELMGVDPWFNGENALNPNKKGSGTGSNNESKSGIIQLINGIQNQNNFLSAYNKNLGITGYTMFTLNLD